MALIVKKTTTGREYKVTGSLHMTIQTAVRIETLTALGAGKYEKKMYEKKEKRTDKYEKKVYEKKDKRTGKYEKKVYEKKEKSAGKYEKKVAGLHLGKLGAKLTILIPVEGPYKPAHYRY